MEYVACVLVRTVLLVRAFDQLVVTVIGNCRRSSSYRSWRIDHCGGFWKLAGAVQPPGSDMKTPKYSGFWVVRVNAFCFISFNAASHRF